MVSFNVLLALTSVLSTTFSSPVPNPKNVKSIQFQKRDYNYDSGTLRGVNLGGWLVLEPYMTPSLFEAFGDDETQIPVDEYHYTQVLGYDEAKSRLEQHWSSFIVESDIESIAGVGLNFVRIPIGYWAFKTLDGDPYVQGAEYYLDQALGWARKYGVKAWIDLHGAPGSQNGFDNSGLRDTLDWQNGDNVQVTLEILDYIFNKYGGDDYSDVVIGIEALNEPLGPSLDMDKIFDFYGQAYQQLRATGSTQNLILHDAFQAAGYFDNSFQLNDYWNVVIDHHHYQVFSTGELNRDIDQHLQIACEYASQETSEYHWNVVGEWSAALTDCAKWLNGVNRGARWDQTFTSSPSDNTVYHGSCEGSQDITTWDDTTKANHRKYIEAQLDAYEQRGGWVFWSWKTESAIEWDLQKLIYYQVFPSPLDSREYPNQCNFS